MNYKPSLSDLISVPNSMSNKDREMSQQEQEGEIHSTAALNALEESIKQLTYEFQGDNAFNFSHEMELASYLLLLARQKYTHSRKDD